jgi:hypothetical protein
MIHSKDLIPNGNCHFCDSKTDREPAKFCSRSCNARYGNVFKIQEADKKRNEEIASYNADPKKCLFCGSPMHLKEGQRVYDAMRNNFCNKSCSAKHNNLHRNAKYRCKWCGKLSKGWYCNEECKEKFYIKQNRPPKLKRKSLAEKTKGEVFAAAKNYASARSNIQKHARRVYKNSNSLDKCLHCGYAVGIDVCHIRDSR